jgi:hypothetical protein
MELDNQPQKPIVKSLGRLQRLLVENVAENGQKEFDPHPIAMRAWANMCRLVKRVPSMTV